MKLNSNRISPLAAVLIFQNSTVPTQDPVLQVIQEIIGVSVSEPHIYESAVNFLYLYISCTSCHKSLAVPILRRSTLCGPRARSTGHVENMPIY